MTTTTLAPRAVRRRPDFALWRAALLGVPRVDQDAWRRLDPLSRWLVAARAGVLIITVLPCLLAGLLAAGAGAFDWRLFGLVTAGLVLAHATNNLVNDLTDFVRGVDRDNYFRARYGTQPLEQGLMTVRQSVLYSAATGAVALGIGIALVSLRGGMTLPLLLAGAFFVLFYTWPLKGIGLGEVAVLLVWGPLMVGGAYYVITGALTRDVVLFSLVYGMAATTVIFGKHIDKLDEDRAKGIHTLPVLLGERRARWVAMALLVLPYLLVVWLVVSGANSPLLFAVALALPQLRQALRIHRAPRPAEAPPRYPRDAWPLWFVSFAFVHNRAFGSWLFVGLLGDVVLNRLGPFAG